MSTDVGEAARDRSPRARWVPRAAVVLVAVAAVAAMVFGMTRLLADEQPPVVQAREDAERAIAALRDGDLETLGRRLSVRRGNEEFANIFARAADPRSLGDALGTVADQFDGKEFDTGFDVEAYELLVTDLAGALSLAARATGDRALPDAWTDEFVTATTHPEKMKADAGAGDDDSREAQDAANKQNLLLLLSRGQWPTEFLKTATEAFVEYDKAEGDEA